MRKIIRLLFVALVSTFISFESIKYQSKDDVVSTEEIGYNIF